MNKDLLNILSNSSKDINNQQLLDYISGKLPEHEKHEIEMQLENNDFIHDAIEGLENVKDKHAVNVFVDQINREFQKKLQKKSKKHRRKLSQQRWIYAAIILILAVVIAAWLMIVKYQQLKLH